MFSELEVEIQIHQKDALGLNALGTKQMDEPVSSLQTIQPNAGPANKLIDSEGLVLHNFESVIEVMQLAAQLREVPFLGVDCSQ